MPVNGSRSDEVGAPRAPRAYDVVLDWLEDALRDGDLHAGDQLPGERELSARLGVSRAAVREALRVLEALGAVVQRTGSGPSAGTTLVAAPADALTRFLRLHVQLASIDLPDVIRARIALERESARLAAVHADAADLDELDSLVRAMGASDVAADAFNELDTAFHIAIARATASPLVSELTIALRAAMRPNLLAALAGEPDLGGVERRLHEEHAGIRDAIRARDPDRAAVLVDEHIAGFYGDVLGSTAGGRRT